jgi:hypothetical protein
MFHANYQACLTEIIGLVFVIGEALNRVSAQSSMIFTPNFAAIFV